MEAKQKPCTRDAVKYHPFEPVTDKLNIRQHHWFVKRVLRARIKKGEITEYVQTRHVLPLHEIFNEEPTLQKLE